jgi:Uma2 family endonuclease
MPVATFVSVDEYLRTAYSPDCDYVDGVVLERNLGEYPHSRTQALTAASLLDQERQWGIIGLMEQRVRVMSSRFRIVDICALGPGAPREDIVCHPPFLCIEILSKDDSMAGMMERIDDYLGMGVPNVSVVDPSRRRGYHFTSDGMHEAKGGILRTRNPDLAVRLARLFD